MESDGQALGERNMFWEGPADTLEYWDMVTCQTCKIRLKTRRLVDLWARGNSCCSAGDVAARVSSFGFREEEVVR